MKQRIILLMLVAACILTCGCKQETDDFETLPNAALGALPQEAPETEIEEGPKEEPAAPTHHNDLFLSFEKKENGEIITTHYDFHQPMPRRTKPEVDYISPPSTYDEVMDRMEKKQGILVAGYAYGIREGHYKPDAAIDEDTWQIESGTTRTRFKIQHIYYGQCQSDEIIVAENYVLREENSKIVFFCASGETTHLKDDRLVLLYLIPYGKEPNTYYPVYREELTLGEGYNDFERETYIRQLCGFYQGDPAMYQFPEGRKETIYILLEDGTFAEETTYVSGAAKPPEIKSDNEILEDLLKKENRETMMIRTALEHKVAIYPEGHIKNPIKQNET